MRKKHLIFIALLITSCQSNTVHKPVIAPKVATPVKDTIKREQTTDEIQQDAFAMIRLMGECRELKEQLDRAEIEQDAKRFYKLRGIYNAKVTELHIICRRHVKEPEKPKVKPPIKKPVKPAVTHIDHAENIIIGEPVFNGALQIGDNNVQNNIIEGNH